MTIQVDTDWWKNIFDAVYLMTDSRSICDDTLTRNEVDFIETALGMKKSAPVLDLCGGQGRHAVELSRRGFTNVTVLDYSDYLIQMGKQQANKQKLNTFFVQGDARDTRLAEENFRLLMPKAELLLDLPDKKYVLKNFKPISIHKVGDTIEVTRTRELDHDVIYCREVVICTEKGCLRENNYCVRLYTPEKISGVLRSIGFSDISFQKDFMDRQEQGDYGTMTNRMVVKAHKKK